MRLASGLAEGSIAALNYAKKLMQLPQGLFVLAVSTAIFPTLSKMAVRKRSEEMSGVLRKGLATIMLLAFPAAAGLLVLREPVVVLLFGRGAFDANAVVLTAHALLYYSLGLIFLCFSLPLTRGFFALQDMRTPLLVSLSTIGIKLILSMVLIGFLQHAGLALATSLTILAKVLLLSFLLQRRLPGLFDRAFYKFMGAILFVSLVMGGSVYVLDCFLNTHLVGGGMALLIRVGLDIGFGIFVFGALAWMLKLGELRYLVHLIRNMIHR